MWSIGLRIRCSKLPWRGACEDCGSIVTHGKDELLCAGCHRTLGSSVKRVGEGLRRDAAHWLDECRASTIGLPAAVVDSFLPSTACLCTRADGFYRKFMEYRKQPTRRCVPCGARKTSQWCFGGSCHQQDQVFFAESVGSKRTTTGMPTTKKVIAADSSICNTCHLSFHNAVGNVESAPIFAPCDHTSKGARAGVSDSYIACQRGTGPRR